MPSPPVDFITSKLLIAAIICAACSSAVAEDLPVSGKANPNFAAFDDAMQRFMQEHDISAGTIAIRYKNQLVFERGYGWSDELRTKKLDPNALFRLGGLSKPITAATVRQLIQQRKLSPDTKVIEFLKLKPREGDIPDPRVQLITVEHLLTNKAGWDPDAYNPLRKEREITEEMKLDHPPTPIDLATYMMGKPLQSDPGSSQTRGLDFGYVLLGLVIEKASGSDYYSQVQKRLLMPMGIKDAFPVRSLPKDCQPREVWYSDPVLTSSVVEPENLDPVPMCYGGFVWENHYGAWGWVMSAASFARFMETFDWQGNRQQGGHWHFHWQMPGSYAVAICRKDGMKIVALFNKGEGDAHTRGMNLLTAAADEAEKKLARGLPAKKPAGR